MDFLYEAGGHRSLSSHSFISFSRLSIFSQTTKDICAPAHKTQSIQLLGRVFENEPSRILVNKANLPSYRCKLFVRLEGVMNLLRNGLLMRKTGDRRRTDLTEESASQCGFSAEFITPSRGRVLCALLAEVVR